MKRAMIVVALVVLLSSSVWAGQWVSLSDPSVPGYPYAGWTVTSNVFNTNTGIWVISFDCRILPTSAYRVDNIKAYVTYATHGGERMTYLGNGSWVGGGAATTYIGPDAVSYEMLDPNWYYADHRPADFSKAYPTISLPSGGPGQSSLMTWTMAWAGVDSVFYVGSVVFGEITPVPEPSSALALLSGLAGLGTLAIRRRR